MEIRVSHILVSKFDEADHVLKELKSGKEFEELAKKFSSCPSWKNGGDLGFFSKGQMVKEFEDAAFSLAQGQVSGPVRTQFGIHIIKLLEKRESVEPVVAKAPEPALVQKKEKQAVKSKKKKR
ncbi:MAG: peptidylprolyl isomerase [Candidatus Micrarchaeota archaeon]